MGHVDKTIFKMPSPGELGTSGNRRPIDITALDDAFNDYTEGDGLVMDKRGVIYGGNSRPAKELLNNDDAPSLLSDIKTTM